MAVDLLHWRALTTAINEIPVAPSFLLDKLYRTREQHLSEDIDVDILVGGKKLAPFVSPIEAGVVINNLGRKMQTVKTPRIRPKKVLTATELLAIRAPGAQLFATGSDIDSAKNQKIALELQDLRNRIDRTMEWMAAQSLQGKLTVTQDNIAFEVDFLFPSAHKPVLTGTDLWTDTTTPSDPLGKIREWKRLVSNATGFTADTAICGHEVVDALLKHTKIREMLNVRNLSIGQLSVGSANYIGSLVGVDIYEYDAQYYNASDVATDFIPSDSFILYASQAPFRLHFGPIQDLDLNALAAQPYFAKSWVEKDPSILWMLAESRPLPVPHWPEAIVFATVV